MCTGQTPLSLTTACRRGSGEWRQSVAGYDEGAAPTCCGVARKRTQAFFFVMVAAVPDAAGVCACVCLFMMPMIHSRAGVLLSCARPSSQVFCHIAQIPLPTGA